MSSKSAPFGMRAAYHLSGETRPSVTTITAASAAAIYSGDPIVFQADGSIAIATNSGKIDGYFLGCEYVDVNGKPNESNFWPALTNATNIVAYVQLGTHNMIEIQANGSVAQSAVGNHANITIGTPSTMLGISGAMLDTSSLSASVQKQLQVIGLKPNIDNAWGDAYTVVLCRLAATSFDAAPPAV